MRALLFLPLYHVYGMVNVNMAYLFSGFSLVVLRKFEPAAFLSAIETYRVIYRMHRFLK